MKLRRNKMYFGALVLVLSTFVILAGYYWYRIYNPAEEYLKQDIAAEQTVLTEVSTAIPDPVLYPEKYNWHGGILVYHRIVNDPKNKLGRWVVSPDNFERQIKYLLDGGVTFVKLETLYSAYASTTSDNLKNTLVLTFDDAYRDFYTTVFPLLKKYNIPATVFVITSDVGKNGNVTWDMLREMQLSGLVEIGSHTVHHYDLTRTRPETVLAEMKNSKNKLEMELGLPVRYLAYPFGSANLTTAKAAEESGYNGALRVLAGQRFETANPFMWRRMVVLDNDYGLPLLRRIHSSFEVLK